MRRFFLIVAMWFVGMLLDAALTNYFNWAEAAPASAPAFYVNDARCSESIGQCTVAISFAGGNGRGSWIKVSTSNGTALAPADYGARSIAIYVSPGRSASISIPIVDDKLLEGDEYFFVSIAIQQNARIGRARGVVTIVDNDLPPPPPPSVTWTKCADEGGTCYVVGTANVRYGVGSVWTYPVSITGSITCSNSYWGDPVVGTPKQCQTDGTPAAPPPPPPVICPDGTTVPAGQTCPVVTNPPPTGWVSAPLRGGGFARVTASTDPDWDVAGPGNGRKLVVGEIVALYINGWGVNYDGRTTFAIHALSDGGDGRAWASSLEGIAPVGAAPALPADWYYGWLGTAARSCGDAFGRAGYPGIVQGQSYRYALWVGGTTKIPTGQPGAVQTNFWTVPAADPYLGPAAVVTGDCLLGQ